MSAERVRIEAKAGRKAVSVLRDGTMRVTLTWDKKRLKRKEYKKVVLVEIEED